MASKKRGGTPRKAAKKRAAAPASGNSSPNGVAAPDLPLPEQKAFFKIPARFGHVPVAEEPLGYDKERRFEFHYPRVELPFQLVDTVETGAGRRYEKDELFPNGLNRLFFGDCLHVMRMLPSECIDLIYIDPPFFSGRNYNIIFGDKNEVRSFTDIWEGGMPGYLIWLNARLYEMKRLLKRTGALFVHCDWHASHYIKIELDKVFGYECFLNEIVWKYDIGSAPKTTFPRKHDVLLRYGKTARPFFFSESPELRQPYEGIYPKDQQGRIYQLGSDGKRRYKDPLGKMITDVWTDTQAINIAARERIGYPTQKPEKLLKKVVLSSCPEQGIVADFFVGSGTSVAVAHLLGRRWIGCDISRVAVAITADRIARILAPNIGEARVVKTKRGDAPLLESIAAAPTLTTVKDARKKAVELSPLRDTGYTVEHWGIYEINQLTALSQEEFRAFVVACYGARKWTGADPNIHGVKVNELIWVAGPRETDVITPSDVKAFAEAVIKSRKAEERQAVMIGWAIDPKARDYAARVMALGEQKPVQFIKLRLWPLAGEDFKSHVTKKHEKYRDFFAFILPPDIPRVGVSRLVPCAT